MAAVIGNREISLGVMGGTLITAACYSGGNVFGCSPYDAATTRYLKATYGAYWQAIRDYGLANPQLVPWINEDNDLIVSLVEVGKERWLVGDGVAYIKTGIVPTDSTLLKAKVKVNNFSSYAPWLFGVETNASTYRFGAFLDANYIALRLGDSRGQYNGQTKGNVFDIEFGNGIAKVNDSEFISGATGVTGQTFDITLYTMNKANSYGTDGSTSNCQYAFADFTEKHFVPMIHNGAAGMLDIVNAQWYGNANTSGAFTIELTDTPN